MIRDICKDVIFLAQRAEPATPDDLPVAAYAYCSRHGLWKTGI